jgi:hypothetical protein
MASPVTQAKQAGGNQQIDMQAGARAAIHAGKAGPAFATAERNTNIEN